MWVCSIGFFFKSGGVKVEDLIELYMYVFIFFFKISL